MGEKREEMISMRTRILAFVGVMIVGYVMAYFALFDRTTPSYNIATGQEKFPFSPKWVRYERLPYDISIYGKRVTIWNYIFFPVDFIVRKTGQ